MPQPMSVESSNSASLPDASPDATLTAPIKVNGTSPSDEDLIALTRAHVRAYMSRYDSSHDFAHIERVLGLALHILSCSISAFTSTPCPAPASSSPTSTSAHTPPARPLSRTLITLAALLHDIGDKKYLPPPSASSSSTEDGTTLALTFLLSNGCDASLAQDVQDIVNAVSYSHEIAHPDVVQEVLARLPELGCVQDADRLDAVGAVGVARAFTYAASVRAGKVAKMGGGRGCGSGSMGEAGDGMGGNCGKGGDRKGSGKGQGSSKGEGEDLSSSMEDTMRHFEEKLVRLEGLMKTGRGREMARERTERLRVFERWWREEVKFAHGGGM